MLYIVICGNTPKYFLDKTKAFSYLIRRIILERSFDSSYGIEVYDDSTDPLVFVEYLVIKNITEKMREKNYKIPQIMRNSSLLFDSVESF